MTPHQGTRSCHRALDIPFSPKGATASYQYLACACPAPKGSFRGVALALSLRVSLRCRVKS